MSRTNGEKARASIAKRNRTKQRVKDRARLGVLSTICRKHGLRARVMRFALEELGPVPHVRHDSQAS